MKLLLDSNVLLWTVFDRSRIPAATLTLLEDTANPLQISIVSLWEIAIKVIRGKLPIPGNSVSYLLQQVYELGIQVLPVTEQHILHLEKLPDIHRDPFDRMLIAQAVAMDLAIVTSDETFASYHVTTLWK